MSIPLWLNSDKGISYWTPPVALNSHNRMSMPWSKTWSTKKYSFVLSPLPFVSRFSLQSKIGTQIVNSLVNQQQDTLRGIIEDFEEKEKARLEQALQSESGQQQLAIRTYRVQLGKQNDRLNTLQTNIGQAQDKKEQARNTAVQVRGKAFSDEGLPRMFFALDQGRVRETEK